MIQSHPKKSEYSDQVWYGRHMVMNVVDVVDTKLSVDTTFLR